MTKRCIVTIADLKSHLGDITTRAKIDLQPGLLVIKVPRDAVEAMLRLKENLPLGVNLRVDYLPFYSCWPPRIISNTDSMRERFELLKRWFHSLVNIAKDNTSKTLRLMLSSGDNEDYPGCRLHLWFWKYVVIVKLPQIIRPYQEKVVAKFWDAETIMRMGRNWYYKYTERQYGFYLYENHFNILYGKQECDNHNDDQRWSCFLPWSEWRFVRHSFYDLAGNHFWTNDGSYNFCTELGKTKYDEQQAAKDQCPKITFLLRDFDGEAIEATTFIEEREWLLGVGWFKWLSLFASPRISRSLSMSFDKETGKGKGSWKGGTIGTGINMLPGELHEAAFRRYCDEHSMIFVGRKESNVFPLKFAAKVTYVYEAEE